MGFTTVFGKILIVASIVFEAYLFFADRQTIAAFDKQLNQAIAPCHCLTPEIQALVKEHLRLVIAGLLATSVFTLICRCWSLKLPTLLGLGLLLWVEHHEVFRTVPTLALLENTGLWHSIGLLGVVIYLMGAECTSCDKKCEKAESKGEPKSSTADRFREEKEEEKKKKKRA
jgi:hypothetical protein